MENINTLAFILPAFNEATVINGVLKDLPKSIKIGSNIFTIKIVVVNDCSTDDTRNIVEKFKHIYLINHILNSGAGAATRTGLNYAKEIGCHYAITMDADGQHATADVIRLAKAIIHEEADMLIGSRLIKTQGMPWYRVVGNKGLSFITLLIFGVFVGDSQSGLKALNEKALHSMNFHSNNYAFCSEMIWKAHQSKLRIKEIPIQAIYTDYSLSKGQTNWSGAFQIIRQLLKRRIMHFING